ncbi:tetratricopeptide repeat protein [Helicobacter turcicus]|uniref:Tetratricopeptide repeat protein n=1 Tax=Helicobacter turcicus TaxID=2867412 RepID=A0ABS7JKY7_9HELI|nr:tetratricopeptide repeat protein [Helicobacter turcicus]MBX7490064.1 hypothetical protein [Helicobacter turcicus]MBX7544923.1 hypothetical protein [Helicobacter turcicus]
MQKLFASSLIVASLVFAQEPSAFNAGGITPQKTELQILNEKLFNLSAQVKNIEESQEGLKSVFEGQIQKVQDVASKIDLLRGENNATIAEVRKHTDSNFVLQNENIEKIKQSISALGALIKKTNAQMQSEINILKEKIAVLESTQVMQIANSETAIKETESANATSNISQESPESLAVDALIASAENTAQIKTANLETPISKTPNDSTMSNVKGTEDLSLNEKNENTQKFIKQKINVDSKTNSKSVNNKSIEKVESKEVIKAEKITEISEKNTESERVESKNNSTKKETPKVVDLKKKSLASVFKDGEQFYKNKNYEKADEYLRFAVKGSYKPARGNYLLGEISFEQKRYEDAIYYYKTSATRYDKAEYMPRLMLHSAKSFSALKEEDNAKRFLETLIALYPKSNEAKEAKKLIK